MSCQCRRLKKYPKTFPATTTCNLSSSILSSLQQARHRSTLMLEGDVPATVCTCVCGADFLVVAIGDTLWRLTVEIAVDLISDSDRSLLKSSRVGVRTPSGCEAIVHATRHSLGGCRPHSFSPLLLAGGQPTRHSAFFGSSSRLAAK